MSSSPPRCPPPSPSPGPTGWLGCGGRPPAAGSPWWACCRSLPPASPQVFAQDRARGRRGRRGRGRRTRALREGRMAGPGLCPGWPWPGWRAAAAAGTGAAAARAAGLGRATPNRSSASACWETWSWARHIHRRPAGAVAKRSPTAPGSRAGHRPCPAAAAAAAPWGFLASSAGRSCSPPERGPRRSCNSPRCWSRGGKASSQRRWR
mmetsp:Transcript_58941/g.140424  ORF Transcript_58941/g.140424 Transcript_58941/m.140424 type:complete len:207 (+) Transcript_58941:244-864(+)